MATRAAVDVDLPDKDRTRMLLTRDLHFLILQHLREKGFKETAHCLEQESGLYFDINHLEDLVQCGAWDVAERYLGGFTRVDANPCSDKIFFAIRKQKCLEDLVRYIAAKDGEGLVNDLKALGPLDDEVAKTVGALENFRQFERLDTAPSRNAVFLEIKNLIKANPLFKDKLDFPLFEPSRLWTMMNQSLRWQHHQCKNPKQSPEMMSLFSDHSCDSSSNGAKSATKNVTP